MPLVPSLALALLCAAPAEQPIQLASPGLQVFQVEPKLGRFINARVAQELTLQGLRVVTEEEIGALIGLERQRQLLGCSDDEASCLTEMGDALGVDGMLTGSVARTGAGYELNLKIVSARDARTLAAASVKAADEEKLLEDLGAAAPALAANVARALDRPLPGPASGLRSWAWAPAVGGGLSAVAATVFFVSAKADLDTLNAAQSGLGQQGAASLRDSGNQKERTGFVLAGVAVVALGTAGAMWLWGGPREGTTFAAIPLQGGAAVSVSGSLP